MSLIKLNPVFNNSENAGHSPGLPERRTPGNISRSVSKVGPSGSQASIFILGFIETPWCIPGQSRIWLAQWVTQALAMNEIWVSIIADSTHIPKYTDGCPATEEDDVQSNVFYSARGSKLPKSGNIQYEPGILSYPAQNTSFRVLAAWESALRNGQVGKESELVVIVVQALEGFW